MFVLYEAEYPPRTFAREALAAAWEGAGLDPAMVPSSKKQFGPPDVRALVRETVAAAGGTANAGTSTTIEVPDAQLPLLEKLEAFYLSLYPEMKEASYLKSFHFERLEWLGEY